MEGRRSHSRSAAALWTDEDAPALIRPDAEAQHHTALRYVARLRTRNSRGTEAFDLLKPHITEWFLAAAFVEAAAGTGRDEAIAPLRTRETTSVNNRDQLADLLAGHRRLDELRRYAATEDHGHAVQRLAEILEERGDVEPAIRAHREPGNPVVRPVNAAVPLIQLLLHHGRGGGAIHVMPALAEEFGADDWIVHTLCDLHADHGRPKQTARTQWLPSRACWSTQDARRRPSHSWSNIRPCAGLSRNT